ncbi:unnamed protein product [Nippostrongylus brasiliensis]|uniref:Uncharacterized protein n=1 Tax=Nippostrongylus brasiliensis TaxID=27835 RepID=A0A158R375_NIPBR|nr:unnamed protein product [Nippostrongylus brasiliensis]
MMGPEGKSSPREHYTAMDKNRMRKEFFEQGIRLAWKIWHVWRTKVDTQELENDPIKVLSETLQRDFLSHIADSGLAF